MRAEVVAVGTELLLGQIVDTNSSWLGQRLALAGIDSHFQTKVGDNQARIVAALRTALSRSDAVITCGGLGPTQDDITREAIAEVMGVELVTDSEVLEWIEARFRARHREMAPSNARQAEVPAGATVIPQVGGTAPGLICPVGGKVIYAVPGVPGEMKEMVERAVVPDLQSRAGAASVILSRTLRTWGLAESTLAEVVAPRLAALDEAARAGAGLASGSQSGPEVGSSPTIAFLASGIEGIKVRVTAKAADRASALALLDAEEAELRALLGDRVFGLDDQTMEHSVAGLLRAAGLSLGLAESLTGGLVASRMVDVPGASEWFKGSVVAYDTGVKHRLLGVPDGPVVSEQTALAMAEGARRVLGADIGLGITGVAGPDSQDGVDVGTVWCGLAGPGATSEGTRLQLPGDRGTVRQLAAISLVDLLRRRLLSLDLHLA
ncbi:MAG: competence/damage-inducible protein A [Acidimicrobiales bacterium]